MDIERCITCTDIYKDTQKTDNERAAQLIKNGKAAEGLAYIGSGSPYLGVYFANKEIRNLVLTSIDGKEALYMDKVFPEQYKAILDNSTFRDAITKNLDILGKNYINKAGSLKTGEEYTLQFDNKLTTKITPDLTWKGHFSMGKTATHTSIYGTVKKTNDGYEASLTYRFEIKDSFSDVFDVQEISRKAPAIEIGRPYEIRTKPESINVKIKVTDLKQLPTVFTREVNKVIDKK